MERTSVKKIRWGIFAVTTVLFLHMGILGTWTLFEQIYVSQYGWSSLAASMPYSCGLAAYSLASFGAGVLVKRLGLKKILGLSFLSFVLAFAGVGVAADSFVSVYFYEIFSGAGVAFAYTCVIRLAMEVIAPEHTGVVSGVLLSAFAISTAYLSSLIQNSLQYGSVEMSFRKLAALILGVLAISIAVIWRTLRTDFKYAEGKRKASGSFKESLVNSRSFRAVFFLYFAGCMAGFQVNGHIVHIAQIQAELSNAVILVSGFSAGNCIGRLVSGLVCDRFKKKNYAQILFLGNAFNMLLFSLYTNQITLLTGFFLAGFTYGAVMVLTPQFISQCFPQGDFSDVMGYAGIAPGIAAFAGPVVTGICVDLSGSYYMVYLLGCVIMLGGCVVVRKGWD